MTSTDEQTCTTANVIQQLANLRTHPSVAKALSEGRLHLTGLYFDLSETRMYTVDESHGLQHPIPTT